MTVAAGDFMPLNAQASLSGAVRNNITKLRPGARPAQSPEPDREHVDRSEQKASEPEPPKAEAPPVAAKRKRVRLADKDKQVAVARVASLVKAGEAPQKACAKVAKEFGASPLSVKGWYYARDKVAGPKQAKRAASNGRASKKESNGASALGLPVPTALIGDRFMELLADSIGPIVRNIVREEIRRMLS